MERIIYIEVPRVDYDKLSGDRLGESSATIRQRVQAARHIIPMLLRERQLERFAGMNIVCPVPLRCTSGIIMPESGLSQR